MKKMRTENCADAAATNRRPNGFGKAFTLAEVLIATVLIGLAIVSLVMASKAFTQVNSAAVKLTNAEFLIDQIRELTTPLDVVDPQSGTANFGPETGEYLSNYDDLDDFDGISFSPPINASRQQLTDMSAFTQQIVVENVSATNFEQVVADHSSPFVRITVRIFLQNEELSSRQWLRARY
jgi:type II secretory pathway pseudopilin PulG